MKLVGLSRRFVTLHCIWLIVLVGICVATANAQKAAPAPSKTPPASDNDVVKISTNLIQLDVTIVDAKGKIVKDVRPEEIEVYENGEKQKITNFSFVAAESDLTQKNDDKAAAKEVVPVPTASVRPEQIRRTVALVVDDLALSFESAYHTRRALRKFVDDQMQEGDLVAIIRTGAGIGALQQFTADKSMLYAAIERVKWNPNGNGGITAFAPAGPSFADMVRAAGGELNPNETGNLAQGQAAFEDFQTSTYATGTLGALRYIVNGMSELPGRKSVILFSEGWEIFQQDEHGFTKSGNVYSFLQTLVEEANRASVVFYTVDTRGLVYTGPTAADQVGTSPGAYSALLSSRSAQLFDTQAGMEYLSHETGGLTIKNRNDLSGGVKRILEDQSYYLIAYEPDSDTFDAKTRKFNKIDIKVIRKGLTARYRSGFFNVADSARPKPSTTGMTPMMQLQHALMSPFAVNDIPLRLNALFGNEASGSYVRSLLHIQAKDLKFTDEPNGSKKVVFDVWAASFGDNGVPVDQITKTYTLTIEPQGYQKILNEGILYYFMFPVKKAGGYQYRVAIRDTQGGKTGSASQFIRIPDIKKGRLTTSSIVIENLSLQAWQKLVDANGGGSNSTSSVDTALRRVKLGSVLRYGLEIYNAKLGVGQKPTLQSRIRVFREGKLVLDGQPIPVDLNGQSDMRRVQLNGALKIVENMLPGDYILQVIVTDTLAKKNQQIASQFVQFEVVDQ